VPPIQGSPFVMFIYFIQYFIYLAIHCPSYQVVEMAPAFNLADSIRQALFADAVKIAKHVGYRCCTALLTDSSCRQGAGAHTFTPWIDHAHPSPLDATTLNSHPCIRPLSTLTLHATTLSSHPLIRPSSTLTLSCNHSQLSPFDQTKLNSHPLIRPRSP
jgi:hypothetical protein